MSTNDRAIGAFNCQGYAVDWADEAQLLQQVRTGGREAFGQLVELYWPRIYRWLYSCTGFPSVAEDLTQEVFLKAWANVNAIDPSSGSLRPWLFRIASNVLVDWRRRQHTQKRLIRARAQENTLSEPIDNVAGEELCQRLWEAVDMLPLDYRMALLLRVQEQLSFRQIGATLGITEETARWRVFRARSLLVRQLGSLLDQTYSEASTGPVESQRDQPDKRAENQS